MQHKQFLDIVSRETMEKLEQYQALLVKWQGAVNLVSSKTLVNMWERHFMDSLQLSPLLPEKNQILFDFGSGAGFPGLVLAMVCPSFTVHLFESDHRKCTFLSTVSRETKTRIALHNERIEDFSFDSIPDIITARALAPMDKLLEYSWPFAKKNANLQMLFLKGMRVDEEIKQAEKKYRFSLQKHKSITETNACVLQISDLCLKNF